VRWLLKYFKNSFTLLKWPGKQIYAHIAEEKEGRWGRGGGKGMMLFYCKLPYFIWAKDTLLL